MIRAVGLLALVVALAGFVTPPTGWVEDEFHGKELATKESALSHFGGAPSVATARVFARSAGPGGFYAIMIAGKLTEHRDAAARVEVDSFLGAPKRAELSGGTVTVTQSNSRADAAAAQIEATLQWQDTALQTTTHARLVIAGDSEGLVAVTAECVFAEATPQAARDACIAALATLDPGIAPAKRVPLALAPEGSAPPPVPSAAGSDGDRPSISDGTRTPMPPIVVSTPEPQRTVDRRPVYVGAGIVVLAGLFWWSRRRRERLDASKSRNKDTDD